MRDKDGRPLVDSATGQVRTQPLSSKQMGRSILASALTAMAATEAHQPYRNGNGIWVNPSNEAVAAGQQAFQAGRPQNQLEQASKELSDQRTRQYAIYKANVDQFKMAHEIADVKFADAQKAVEGFASGYEAALRGDFGDGVSPETLDLVGDDAAKAFSQLDPTTHMMVPNGKVTPHVDAAGNSTGVADVHYMILPGQNGKITLDEGMIKAAGLDGKGLTPGQVQIPVSQWSDLVRQQAGRHIVESAVNQVAETIGLKGKDGEPVKLDYPRFVKAARLTPAQMSEFQGLDRNDPVAYQAGIKKINQESGGNLQQALSDQGINIDAKSWDEKRKAEQAKALADAKKGEDAQPADPKLVASFATDIRNDYPDLTAGQISSLTKGLGDNPTNKVYRYQQTKAGVVADRNIQRRLADAKDDENKIVKGQKPIIGIDANNNQVFTNAGSVNEYGLKQVREVGQGEAEKVTNARTLMPILSSTDSDDLGLIQLADKLNKEGKLGVAASKFQDWLNKGGSLSGLGTFDVGDPEVQELFTKLGLNTTALMQVHLGSRGSSQMFEHFQDLANAKTMSADSFIRALNTEYKYVTRKAMLPNGGAGTQQSQQPVGVAPEGTIVNTANGQMIKQGGKWVPAPAQGR